MMTLELTMLEEALREREMNLHKRMQRWREDHAENKLGIPEDATENHIAYLSQTFRENLHALVREAKEAAAASALVAARKKEEEARG